MEAIQPELQYDNSPAADQAVPRAAIDGCIAFSDATTAADITARDIGVEPHDLGGTADQTGSGVAGNRTPAKTLDGSSD